MADGISERAASRPAALAGAFAAHGTQHRVGANHPVALTAGAAWHVREGSADLFLQERAGGVSGRRHLICTNGPGALLWLGAGAHLPPGWRLLAVGHAGTQLASMPGERLEQVLDAEDLARHVRDFADRAADGLAAGGYRPRGVPAPPPAAAPAPQPRAGPPPARARLAAAEQEFGNVVIQAIGLIAETDTAEEERIGSERDRQHRMLDSALADLVEIVDRGEPLGTAPEDRLAQLNLALSRIGRHLRVEFPPQAGLELEGADPVAARVAAAGCRTRVVALRGRWWAQPGTVMLGFMAGTEGPVALIPARSGYRVFDPSTGQTVRAGQPLAQALASHAYAIYRPLPPGAGSVRGLLGPALSRLRADIWLLAGLGTLAGIITLVTPLVTALVYNSVLPTGDRGLLLAISLLLIGAAVTWGLVTLSQNLIVVRLTGHLEASLDPGMMDRILQLPASFLRRYDTGDLASRASGLEVIRQQVSGPVITAILTLVFSVFSVVLLFVYSALLGAVALGTLVFVAAALVLLNLRVIRHQRRVFDHGGDNAADLFQVLQAVSKMRAGAAEPRIMTRWASRFRLQQQESYAAGRLQAWIFALIAALPAALALFLYGATGTVLVGRIPAGNFIAAMTAVGQFTTALAGVALTVGAVMTVIPLWQRLLPLLTEPVEDVVTTDPGLLTGALSVRDVSFRYGDGGPLVLEGISFDVEPGEFVAITGSSGSGKSTLLRLLLGLDQPTAGSVLYDGKDLKSFDQRAARRQFGVVMQDARPMPGELLSMILADTGGTEADAWAAAEAAELADDIRQMPMRMHTVIGEGGTAFSGGQVQRMMIARALIRKPRLLFLDEATSALDDRAQARVSGHIEELSGSRIVIAHRLSTIRRADRIYVLEAGRLVQAGTFGELMAQDGPFRRLARRQLT